MTASSSTPNRIIELDALRGLAVMGIVWMNVYVFAMPSQSYYNPIVWGPGLGEGDAADRLLWAASFVFIEDKFRTLFAMLFGAGCLILLERNSQGHWKRKWRAHFARMLVLFLIGIAHSIFLASNDVLRAYALAGLALPFLANLAARELYAVAVGLVVLHFGAGLVIFGGGLVDALAGRTQSDAALFAERNFGQDEAAVRYSYMLGTEELAERIIRRADSIPEQLIAAVAALPLNLAAMALGMALWKQGMLAGEWRTFLLQRVAAISALCALPVLFTLAWWVSERGFPGGMVGAVSLLLSAPFDILLGLAYAALAMAFFSAGGVITERLVAVGRLSLTNYLMTSVILAAIFASWGLGLFGEVSRVQSLVIGFVPIIGMLAWSRPWIDTIGQGPVERVWRWLSNMLS